MKNFAITLALAAAVMAAPPPKTPSTKKKTSAKTSHPSLGSKSSSTRRSTAGKGKATRPSGALAGVTGPRNHQAVPTPERYKEIQQALVTKGYLKSEPNGVWDANSADALRRFQTDSKLDPSGKLNAPSLIGLGLGPAAQPTAPESAAPQTPAPYVPSPTPF